MLLPLSSTSGLYLVRYSLGFVKFPLRAAPGPTAVVTGWSQDNSSWFGTYHRTRQDDWLKKKHISGYAVMWFPYCIFAFLPSSWWVERKHNQPWWWQYAVKRARIMPRMKTLKGGMDRFLDPCKFSDCGYQDIVEAEGTIWFFTLLINRQSGRCARECSSIFLHRDRSTKQGNLPIQVGLV